jgi:hypothetical protein
MKETSKEYLNSRLDLMWKNGCIDKESVPFIKTAINRPLWASWRFFFRRAVFEIKPRMFLLGFVFLKYRCRGRAMSFLYKYFPGLIIFPYFAAAWNEQSENDEKNAAKTDSLDSLQFFGLFDKTVNS